MKQSIYATIVASLSLLTLVSCGTTPAVENQDTVSVSQTETTTTITEAGNYTYSGIIDPIVVSATKEDDVNIILDNVTIRSGHLAPVSVTEAKNVTISLAEGSTNTIVDERTEEEEVEDFPNAAIFSMSDLNIIGAEGAVLTVTGNLNDGITSKDDLTLDSVTLEVTAKDDGIRGKDSVELSNSTLTIDAGGDGLKSDNDSDTEKGRITLDGNMITIKAGDDGIDTVNAITFISGVTTITDSYEGVESLHITVLGGELSITSQDDGINIAETSNDTAQETHMRGPGGGGNTVVDGLIDIQGGTVIINAHGDGFDSNGNAQMSGGTLLIQGPVANNNGPIDVNGTFDISGGTLFAIGSSGMAETPDATSAQNTLQNNLDTQRGAGTVVAIQDASGKELASMTALKSFQSVTYSAPDLQQGETYTILLDGEVYSQMVLTSRVKKEGTQSGPGAMGGGRAPMSMSLPDNWESMSDLERRAYMESQRPQ